MTDQIEQSIADSLEADQNLLPHMPFLLQDLWALGSSVDHILELTASLDLKPDQTRILDLGCGKGAAAIQIAERFGFREWPIRPRRSRPSGAVVFDSGYVFFLPA